MHSQLNTLFWNNQYVYFQLWYIFCLLNLNLVHSSCNYCLICLWFFLPDRLTNSTCYTFFCFLFWDIFLQGWEFCLISNHFDTFFFYSRSTCIEVQKNSTFFHIPMLIRRTMYITTFLAHCFWKIVTHWKSIGGRGEPSQVIIYQ